MPYRKLLRVAKVPYLPRNQFYVNLVSLDAGSCIRRFSTDNVRTASLTKRLATNCRKEPKHYINGAKMKLLRRSRSVYFFSMESEFFEFGTFLIV